MQVRHGILAVVIFLLGAVFIKWAEDYSLASHTLPRDASTLNRGLMSAARNDPSTVTLQGNAVNISTVARGLNEIIGGLTVNPSSFTLQGNAVNISTTARGVNEIIDGRTVKPTTFTMQGNAVNVSTVAGGLNSILYGTTTINGGLVITGLTQMSSASVNNGFHPKGTGINSISIGENTTSTGTKTVAIGLNTLARNVDSIAIGQADSRSTGTVTIGAGSESHGVNSVALGYTAISRAPNSVAIGDTALATGDTAVSIGALTDATGQNAVSLGRNASASGQESISLGTDSSASASFTTAVGNDTVASADYGVAVGFNAEANAGDAISIGRDSLGSGVTSIAIGRSSIGSGIQSAAVGFQVEASSVNSLAIGVTITNNISTSVMVGFNTTPFRLLVGTSSVSIGDPAQRDRNDGLNVSTITIKTGRVNINGQNYTWPSGGQAADEVLTTNGSGGLSWAAGGGATVTTDTGTLTIGGSGDILLSTGNFGGIPSTVFDPGRSTYNVTSVRVGVVSGSTISASFFQVAQTTVTGAPNPIAFSYLTNQLVISTDATFSVWYSTAFIMYPANRYTIHATSIPQVSNGGNMPTRPRVQMEYWKVR